MNIYNLEDFKCTQCRVWFHPQHMQPYQLPCKHSVCVKCLHSGQDKNKGYGFCPQHKIQYSFNQAKFNNGINQALIRLMKNMKQPRNNDLQEYEKKFDEFVKLRKKDIHLFAQFLDQIYNNEINRLICLKKRIRLQIEQPLFGIKEWKIGPKREKGQKQDVQEARHLLQRIQLYNQLNFQEISQNIITDSTVCLQKHFSLYNMINQNRPQQRKTLKSSLKPQQKSTKYYFPKDNIQNKQNKLVNMIKSVSMPQESSFNLCKQLSSFKLEEDYPQTCQYSYINDLKKDQGKKSQLKEYLSQTNNEESTLRDFQCSKISHKPKNYPLQHHKKRSVDNFNELINSLKSNQKDSFLNNQSILQYSFDEQPIQEQMLLSTHKDFNFMKEFQIPKGEKVKNVEIKHRELIDSDKQKNKYIKKLQVIKTQKACQNTMITQHTLELFNIDIKEIDLKGYLDKINWQHILVIKMVGTNLQDYELNILLNYMIHYQVHSLLLPSNDLQEISLDALIRFTDINTHLKTISLQKNNIQVLSGNCKAKIAMLRKKGLTLYI